MDGMICALQVMLIFGIVALLVPPVLCLYHRYIHYFIDKMVDEDRRKRRV